MRESTETVTLDRMITEQAMERYRMERPDETPYDAPRRTPRTRCRLCYGNNGDHTYDCPEG